MCKKAIMDGFKSGPGGYNPYLSVRGFTHIYLDTCLGGKSVQNMVVFVVFSLSRCRFVTVSAGMECNK